MNTSLLNIDKVSDKVSDKERKINSISNSKMPKLHDRGYTAPEAPLPLN